ncbi:MAG: hypothetical protein ABIG37_02565 [Nanoarchaeota archaeon]|nr:hypothetical protein [Nanoarchaeota archaeon]
MVKKEVKHKISKSKVKKEKSKDLEKLNSMLIENFVNLQKVLTNLSTKFDSLSDQISKLLQLFEISAKSFAEKLETGTPDLEKDKEFLDKLNRLLDQNKVIAKGLTLMEGKMRERLYGEYTPNRPSPRFQNQPQQTRPSREGYMPSSLSNEKPRFRRL